MNGLVTFSYLCTLHLALIVRLISMRYALVLAASLVWLGIGYAAVSDRFVCVIDGDQVRVGLQTD